jgi:glucose dehydrogenase
MEDNVRGGVEVTLGMTALCMFVVMMVKTESTKSESSYDDNTCTQQSTKIFPKHQTYYLASTTNQLLSAPDKTTTTNTQ